MTAKGISSPMQNVLSFPLWAMSAICFPTKNKNNHKHNFFLSGHIIYGGLRHEVCSTGKSSATTSFRIPLPVKSVGTYPKVCRGLVTKVRGGRGSITLVCVWGGGVVGLGGGNTTRPLQQEILFSRCSNWCCKRYMEGFWAVVVTPSTTTTTTTTN